MSRTVSYNGNVYEVENAQATADEIKASMAELFPELSRAVAVTDANGNITFKVQAGTKGMARTVTYNGNVYQVDNDQYTPAEIQKSMAELFPELTRATYVEDTNGNITFKVQAGTKGVQ
jgi:ribulose-5-phosphate 4-epimerase/fuculose-1-phosphate aldolase